MMSRALFLLRFDLLTRVLDEQSGFVSLTLRMVAERVWFALPARDGFYFWRASGALPL